MTRQDFKTRLDIVAAQQEMLSRICNAKSTDQVITVVQAEAKRLDKETKELQIIGTKNNYYDI